MLVTVARGLKIARAVPNQTAPNFPIYSKLQQNDDDPNQNISCPGEKQVIPNQMSVVVPAMPKVAQMCLYQSVKRKCEDDCISQLEQSGPKKRRVQFAESSMCKVVLSATDMSSISNDSDISSESSQSSSQDESLSPIPVRSSATAFSDLALKNGDLYEQCVPTKLEDGPSRVTQTANSLILLLVEHGTVTSQQVSEKLQSVADSSSRRLHAVIDDGSESPYSHKKEEWSPLPPSDSPPASPPTPGSPSSLPLTPRSPTPTAERDTEAITAVERAGPARRGCDDYPLCEGVYARLRALSDRIHANGRAPLLPSTAVMGREFLPALRFLRAAVRDAASNGMRAAAGSSGPTQSPTS